MEEARGSSGIVEKLHRFVWENKKVEVENLLREAQMTQVVNTKLKGKAALHVAAYRGHVEVVELLIMLGHADVHLRADDRDKLPLHVAALYGNDAVVEKLLQYGAASDLHAEDRKGDTPLHHAAQSGQRKIIRRLLSAAPDSTVCIHAKNELQRTPLHYAAGSGKPEAVDFLLETREGQALMEVPDESGALPFHFAARSGDVDSMDKLLIPGDVNRPCFEGLTALHYAAWNGRVPAVKWLMEKGANLGDGSPNTPLHLAAISKSGRRNSVVEAIITKFLESWKMVNASGELAIGLAHERGHDDAVKAALGVLRKFKSNVTGYDIQNFKHKPSNATLLHYAAAHGREEDINWLVDALGSNANVNGILDKDKRAPLHWAAMMGNISTLKALAGSAKANLIQSTGDTHETPLFLALGGDHLNFAEQLLKCDKEKLKGETQASFFTTDQWMEGVDGWLKSYYETKVEPHVRIELEREFNHHTMHQNKPWFLAVTNGGKIKNMYEEIPPVYLALHAGKPDIAKFFQRLSSNVDAVNKKGIYTGRTALHWAVLLRRREIVVQLCDKVPDFKERVRMNEEDAQKISPVQYATERNLPDIESVLLAHDAVKDYINGLYRDRQIYVDSTNAILVGAALIASVTFVGWLQPPMGFIDHYHNRDIPYVAMREVKSMRIFWIFNSLSFFAAIGTVQAGACGVLPLRHVHIGRAVNYIRRFLRIASLLMALSVVCVLGAFAVAGFIVLPPRLNLQKYMIIPVVIGGPINAGLIFCFMQRVLIAPRLFKVWRRQILGTQDLMGKSSRPPDLVVLDGAGVATVPPPQGASPRPSMDIRKPSFSWDDGIEIAKRRLSRKTSSGGGP